MRASERWTVVALVSCVLLVAGLAGVNLWKQARAGSTFDECRAIASTPQLYDVGAAGWEVRCVESVAALLRHPPVGLTVSAVTAEEQRIIYLEAGTPDLEQVLAHEEGHAWAVDKLTDAEREAFSQRVGSPGWRLGGYFKEGNEAWARGFTHCQGFRDSSEGFVPPCEVVEEFLAANP